MRRSSKRPFLRIWLAGSLFAAGGQLLFADLPLFGGVDQGQGGSSDSGARQTARELEAIADLLINDQFEEAKARTLVLLDRDDLLWSERVRAKKLLAKAEAKLDPPAPRPAIEIDRSRADEAGAKAPGAEKPAAQPVPKSSADAPKEASFRARLGVVGSGFREGARGILKVNERGISFVAGPKGEAWSIPWGRLASAGLDPGFWDSPYPVLFVEHSGKKRYVSRVEGAERYQPGKPILDAISLFRPGKREPPKPEGPKSGEPEGEP